VVQQQPVAKQQPPAVTASAPKVQKAPVTRMNISGSSGSNPYLSRIQRLINNAWEAPPVDISGSALSVVVKFRLSRTGAISGVAIDQRSGNEYYDLAGRRAVLRVENYLPPFPAEITEPYFDIYFTFAVGEGSG
jgi:outer membrane biosynthesis protein TonB